jgi:L-alanine-DL-glutamate epimerase-like enolase superfamily enzyme
MRLHDVTLRKVSLPLIRPYVLSYRTFHEFEPIVVEVRDHDGRVGWGEGHISPGSSSETREGGWAFCCEHAAKIAGIDSADAKAIVSAHLGDSKVAATAILTAIEMLEGHPLLKIEQDARLPMLTPFNSSTLKEIEDEVERRLEEGFGTFKIKVGKDASADLTRVKTIQRVINGRATMRLDANRAFSEADGKRFAAGLDPSGIELFEQPCHADDWAANANVAEVSTVPLMLDEPICSIADIERAAEIPNIEYCKLKLKRFGSLDALKHALELVRALDMEPVLGDGTSCEIQCWMEGCVARSTISNAGEFNGFLKPRDRLFANPPQFKAGALVLPKDYMPTMDLKSLAAHEIACERFAAVAATVA